MSVLWFTVVDPKCFLNLLSWKPCDKQITNPKRYHEIQVFTGVLMFWHMWDPGSSGSHSDMLQLICTLCTSNSAISWPYRWLLSAGDETWPQTSKQQKNQRQSNTHIIQRAPDDFDMQCMSWASFSQHSLVSWFRPDCWTKLILFSQRKLTRLWILCSHFA